MVVSAISDGGPCSRYKCTIATRDERASRRGPDRRPEGRAAVVHQAQSRLQLPGPTESGGYARPSVGGLPSPPDRAGMSNTEPVLTWTWEEGCRREVARRSEATTRLAGEWSAYVAHRRGVGAVVDAGWTREGPVAGRFRVRYRSASGKAADRRAHDRVDCCPVPLPPPRNGIPEPNRIAPGGFEPPTSRL